MFLRTAGRKFYLKYFYNIILPFGILSLLRNSQIDFENWLKIKFIDWSIIAYNANIFNSNNINRLYQNLLLTNDYATHGYQFCFIWYFKFDKIFKLPSLKCVYMSHRHISISVYILNMYVCIYVAYIKVLAALSYLRLLFASLSPRRPGFALGSVHAVFVVWDRFFSEFLSFPLPISFHHGSQYSYIIWGINNRSVGGCSSETQCHPIDINNNSIKLFLILQRDGVFSSHIIEYRQKIDAIILAPVTPFHYISLLPTLFFLQFRNYPDPVWDLRLPRRRWCHCWSFGL
jgi:hypothetical protein